MRPGVLLAVAILVASSLAETIPDPTKKQGADHLFRIKRGEKWGYVDRTGKVLIKPRFDEERDFFHGLAGVALDGKWGYIAQGFSDSQYSRAPARH